MKDIEENDRLVAIDERLENLRIVIEIVEFEILQLLAEREFLTKVNKIGFKYSNKQKD